MQYEASEFEEIIDKYSRERRALIPILQDIQAKYNYLPPVGLSVVSQALCIPLIDIMSVATFYNAFSLTPKGEHVITVCMGTACHVRGAPKVLDEFERVLRIKSGETTEDGKFSLDDVACLGCCAIGPVVVADGNYHAQTNLRKVGKILKTLEKEKKENGETKN